jgi:glycosyltransferase involved in cell wall biosynthesis
MTKTNMRLVISAVNFSEGGPLTILQQCIDSACAVLPETWKITVLVHKKELIKNSRVELMEFPQSKRSWLRRLYLEWFAFGRLSRNLYPDLWLSLHDITPFVQARRQAVYCHNSSPFYRLSTQEFWLDPKFGFFNLLYNSLYGIKISRNQSVIVQQNWLRAEFSRLHGHPNIVVAHPAKSTQVALSKTFSRKTRRPCPERPLILFYPSLPRVFKNFETVCNAMTLLPPHVSELLELRITLDGFENRYAKKIYKNYIDQKNIKFIGYQTRAEMAAEYSGCDIVLFPSKLETWGLPISEAKYYGKPLLVADLPYAHETAGDCEAIAFLPAVDSKAWANIFTAIVAEDWEFSRSRQTVPEAPFAEDWSDLWRILTDGLDLDKN